MGKAKHESGRDAHAAGQRGKACKRLPEGIKRINIDELDAKTAMDYYKVLLRPSSPCLVARDLCAD
jgi:hypothetical protein